MSSGRTDLDAIRWLHQQSSRLEAVLHMHEAIFRSPLTIRAGIGPQITDCSNESKKIDHTNRKRGLLFHCFKEVSDASRSQSTRNKLDAHPLATLLA